MLTTNTVTLTAYHCFFPSILLHIGINSQCIWLHVLRINLHVLSKFLGLDNKVMSSHRGLAGLYMQDVKTRGELNIFENHFINPGRLLC
jgi:hypothetical protein